MNSNINIFCNLYALFVRHKINICNLKYLLLLFGRDRQKHVYSCKDTRANC